MNRSRMTFILIIGGAILFVIAATLIGSLSSDNDSGSGATTTQNTNQPEPPKGSVEVIVQSSNTKQLWMDAMRDQFNAQGLRLPSGEQVFITLHHTGQELNQELTPTVWSPANQPWIDEVNNDWRDRNGWPLISDPCPATIGIPLGIAMWRPMAEALGWPSEEIRWSDISALATNPDGWAAYGHPEWGAFKYGHGHPVHSNSGRLSIVAEIYAATGKTDPLILADVNNPVARDAVAAVQTAVVHYGRVDTDLLNKMVQRGPEYLHAVTNYESNVIRWNREYGPTGTNELAFPLVLIYPADGVFWIDHPFCILDRATWVSEKQIEGAKLFRDFVLERPQQEQLVQFGIRPALTDIPLTAPLTLDNGVIPTLEPGKNIHVLPYPDEEVIADIVGLWKEVKKPSTVVMTIDVSGSMNGEPIRAAIGGAQEFIRQMQPNDELIVLIFSDSVTTLEPAGLVGQVGEELISRIGGLYAGGNTALFQATLDSYALIEQMRADDLAAGEQRIYGVVLMSDGVNTTGSLEERDVRRELPDGTESNEVRLYTIAYGAEADKDTLELWANRTNGKFYEGTTENIGDIYFLISSEF